MSDSVSASAFSKGQALPKLSSHNKKQAIPVKVIGFWRAPLLPAMFLHT